MSVNRAFLLGNVARDPEIRSTQTGSQIATLTVATSEQWKDKATGEKRELTEWNRVTVFNPHLVTIIEKYVKKGTRLYLEGEVRTRKWTDRQGEDRFTTEVVLTQYGGKMDIQSSARDSGGSAPRQSTSTDRRGPLPSDLDDEIPF